MRCSVSHRRTYWIGPVPPSLAFLFALSRFVLFRYSSGSAGAERARERRSAARSGRRSVEMYVAL